MTVVLIRPDAHATWAKALRRHAPEFDIVVWGQDEVEVTQVEYALVWKPEAGLLTSFPNLKGIYNLGAGVDALLTDATFPKHIPLARLVDPKLSSGMVEYVVHWVLHFHRDFHRYGQQQTWRPHDQADTAKRAVGILGLGELGQDCAHALLMLGFENVAGWSRSQKELPGIQSFAGVEELDAFLERTEILINLLPYTDDTHHILKSDTFDKLPNGSYFINAGRGETVNESGLIACLQNEYIRAAALDVFETEPLPENHAFWTMPNVTVTPHIASVTDPNSAAQIIAEGLRAWDDGQTPDNLVDIQQGY
ncbi:glyoxylate/hydroxypyruvate reductase A [Magnetovibrio sp. PR-2]|uniref:2-hydroxyacid dehydrogenase n=1 Tax=Magnetovibrio sp. PR-2 TaxID=3120356 RepID=UPI002FCDF3FF